MLQTYGIKYVINSTEQVEKHKKTPLIQINGVSYVIKRLLIVQGFKTDVYSIKKKLLLFKYPNINFYEI